MNDEALKQLIVLLQEQTRLLQVVIMQLEKVNDSIQQVFLK